MPGVCFPCVRGLCPYGRDFAKDCYPNLPEWQKKLFDELKRLRANMICD